MADYTLTINGTAVTTGRTIDVVNPANGQVFAQAPAAGREELDCAVAAAKAALPAWRALSLAERRQKLIEIAQVIEANVDELTDIFVAEQGRPRDFAKQEILGAAFWLRGTASLELKPEVAEENDSHRVEVHHEPLGVVCGIVPWNFPFLLASWKIAPALLTGNTLVLKPSPFTPLATLRLGELAREILPPGVFNVIAGGDELGPLMTAHPGFAKISFTGSTATGKRVMETASKDLKRITLELGGNDAAIVFPDVDIAKVAQQIFFGAFYNTAQVCVATKRLYIHDDIYDALRDQLHAIARHVRVGDGSEPGVMFGPVQNEVQYRRVRALIDEARAAGLTLLEGGAVPNQGYFIPLTLVDNPPEDSRVVVEEAFGPILPLLRFTDTDDVIARANNSDYGLAGAVWSGDVDRAVEVARRLETGTVWINTNLQSTPNTPLAGQKQSGFGVENGISGLLEFTQPKVIHVPKVKAAQ